MQLSSFQIAGAHSGVRHAHRTETNGKLRTQAEHLTANLTRKGSTSIHSS